MRLDELKNDFPDIPDFVHDMIQEEVEKQVNSSNLTPMQRKSKLNRSISRVAARQLCALLQHQPLLMQEQSFIICTLKNRETTVL